MRHTIENAVNILELLTLRVDLLEFQFSLNFTIPFYFILLQTFFLLLAIKHTPLYFKKSNLYHLA